MAKGVFAHTASSIYDDRPEERYQFPSRYLSRAKNFVGDWILYYEPRADGGRMGYTGLAKVQRIVADSDLPRMHVALIEPGSFLPLERFVFYRDERIGYLESDLNSEDGGLRRGPMRWAIRPISELDFHRILARGFPVDESVLPRISGAVEERLGFQETAMAFDHAALPDVERLRVEQTITRPLRDRVFRHHILDAYDKRCALTGFKFINGGGRAEVEAAHIQPVEKNGPDAVQNGIALSGTVHWMFDRGLITLSDDLDILVSRHVNNPDEVWRLVNTDRRAMAPANKHQRPHPRYLDWHRSNCFKA